MEGSLSSVSSIFMDIAGPPMPTKSVAALISEGLLFILSAVVSSDAKDEDIVLADSFMRK
jgi:hypothetical protein